MIILLATMLLFSTNNKDNPGDWRVVNDGVMGGLSEGKIYYNEKKHLIFTGEVSLENNGGFSSIRYPFSTLNVENFEKIELTVKGDGNKYQFRVKENASDYASYIQYFETTGDWQTIVIELEKLYPVFRGRKLYRPNFARNSMSEIGILIGNKKEQSFQLEIKEIKLL